MFAVEEEDNQEEEMFAVVDRQQWNTRRVAEPPLSPDLQQMFASRVAWATRCDRLLAVLTPLDRCRVPSRLRIRNIAHHSDLATSSLPQTGLFPPIPTGRVDRLVRRTTATQWRIPTGKRNTGRDLTHTGLYVIDSDHASSLTVIPDIHPENSFASTRRGGSITKLITGHSVQLPTR